MAELLATFTVPQIILFIVLLAVAFKKIADFLDWLGGKIKKRDVKNQEELAKEKEKEERLAKTEEIVAQMAAEMSNMSKKIDILMQSDKDDIKAWITQQHHYYCYTKEWIDDFTLDTIERRYSHYLEEDGNSFVGDLMRDLRALPKRPMDDRGAK